MIRVLIDSGAGGIFIIKYLVKILSLRMKSRGKYEVTFANGTKQTTSSYVEIILIFKGTKLL